MTVPPVVLVVDVANVMGSRPDGWWRDRAAAATRIVQGLAALPGTVVPPHTGEGAPARVARVLAVVEGRARQIPQVGAVEVVRSPADGDSAVVRACGEVLAAGGHPLAVTADRGLRASLPPGTAATGPGWLLRIMQNVEPVPVPVPVSEPAPGPGSGPASGPTADGR